MQIHKGRKIRILRVMRGITQNELSDRISKTRALVSYIEGTGKVNHYTLQEILKALDVSAEEFEAFEGSPLPVRTYRNGESRKNHFPERTVVDMAII